MCFSVKNSTFQYPSETMPNGKKMPFVANMLITLNIQFNVMVSKLGTALINGLVDVLRLWAHAHTMLS